MGKGLTALLLARPHALLQLWPSQHTPAVPLTSPLSWRLCYDMDVVGGCPLNVYVLEAWSWCGNSERQGNLYEVLTPGIKTGVEK